MPDDLTALLLCELGERILAMREALADPAIAAKPQAAAVAVLLTRGLDGIVELLQRDAVAPLYKERGGDGHFGAADLLAAVSDGHRALGVLHRGLGLLDARWSAAPVDVFLRKVREDATGRGLHGDGTGHGLRQALVVLSDDYEDAGVDVAGALSASLGSDHVAVSPDAIGVPVLGLARIEAANPLTWPRMLPGVARLTWKGNTGTDGRRSDDEAILAGIHVGGPAAFAAHAADALRRPDPIGLEDALARLADTGLAERGSLGDAVSFFLAAARARDAALAHHAPREGAFAQEMPRGPGAAPADPEPIRYGPLAFPEPVLPESHEAEALLRKLADGTPINAIGPSVPGDFLGRLERVDNSAAFYELIGPLQERPASIAAILGIGWLYKVRYSYPLFGRLLDERRDVRAALDAYRPHMLERNELLLQSIEAAHVHGIFERGKMDA